MKSKVLLVLISLCAYLSIFPVINVQFEGRDADEAAKLDSMIQQRKRSFFMGLIIQTSPPGPGSSGQTFSPLDLVLDKYDYNNIGVGKNIRIALRTDSTIVGLMIRLPGIDATFDVKDNYTYIIRLSSGQCTKGENNVSVRYEDVVDPNKDGISRICVQEFVPESKGKIGLGKNTSNLSSLPGIPSFKEKEEKI